MIRTTTKLIDTFTVFPMLSNLDAYYPDFEKWYFNKVVPGILNGDNKLLLYSTHGEIQGVGLIKDTDEKKIQCIRVRPGNENSGIGIKLLDKAIELLENRSPVITVSEEMINQYSRPFVKRYGFKLSDVVKGQYRKGKLEYHFN